MKVPGAVKILLGDTILLALLYLVEVDLISRDSYADSLNFAPSTNYSVLTRSLILTGRGTRVVSPLTLDWVQVLILALALLNLGYGYRLLRAPRASQKLDVR